MEIKDKTNSPIADVITLADIIDNSKPYTIFDEIHTWKKKKVTSFYAKSSGPCFYKRRMRL